MLPMLRFLSINGLFCLILYYQSFYNLSFCFLFSFDVDGDEVTHQASCRNQELLRNCLSCQSVILTCYYICNKLNHIHLFCYSPEGQNFKNSLTELTLRWWHGHGAPFDGMEEVLLSCFFQPCGEGFILGLHLLFHLIKCFLLPNPITLRNVNMLLLI